MIYEELTEKRDSRHKNHLIIGASSVWEVLQRYKNLKEEYFFVLSLDNEHKVLAIRVVSIGILNRCLVHPREVFAAAIADRAAAIIVAHNHPSGCLTPSEDDKQITERLVKAGVLLGIDVLDHLIFTSYWYTSLLEARLIDCYKDINAEYESFEVEKEDNMRLIDFINAADRLTERVEKKVDEEIDEGYKASKGGFDILKNGE